MSLEHRGYVGLFSEKLDRRRIGELVTLWVERFGSIEQIAGNSNQVATVTIRLASDVVWQKDLQFRILSGEQFAWIYITLDHQAIETTGLAPHRGDSLSRNVLVELPGCIEIIDEHNDHRLDELEAQGLM